MNDKNIIEIVTARDTRFTVGLLGGGVKEITFAEGDPTMGVSSCYEVRFTDDDFVLVYDAVEVWYGAK